MTIDLLETLHGLSKRKVQNLTFSGEINFKVEDKDRIIEAVLAEYQALPDAKLTDIDGIRLDYPIW